MGNKADEAHTSTEDSQETPSEPDTVPLANVDLPEALRQAVQDSLGIRGLFRMQVAVFEHLTKWTERDLVLSSPTGSGKTLAYALPILAGLSNRVVPKLRAVVVVPTKDLARQIHTVFSALCASMKIALALAVGSSSVRQEAQFVSAAEVLIATPGRLVEHTKRTAGFTLEAVRYLVLDESDRLLQDAYYDWIDVVLPACRGLSGNTHRGPRIGHAALGIACIGTERESEAPNPDTKPQIILASATQTRNPKRLTLLGLHKPGSISIKTDHPEEQKSELQSRAHGNDDDQDKLDVYVPETLTESAYVMTRESDKLLVLMRVLGLVDSDAPSGAKVKRLNSSPSPSAASSHRRSCLIFSNSVEDAHRLSRLLEIAADHFEKQVCIAEVSGDVSPRARLSKLRMARAHPSEARRSTKSVAMDSGRIVIVCTDLLARGIDLPLVDAVVNYDAPMQPQTYVHRVGRTARAGKQGDAVTLLLAKQARHFKAVVRSVRRVGGAKPRIRTLDITEDGLSGYESDIEIALERLRFVLRLESLGLLDPTEALPKHVMRQLRQHTGKRLDSGANGERLESMESNEPRQKRPRLSTNQTLETGDAQDTDDDIAKPDTASDDPDGHQFLASSGAPPPIALREILVAKVGRYLLGQHAVVDAD